MSLSLFAIVLLVSSVLHYSIQKIFIHYKKFDDFNHRSTHKTLATRTGGIGVFFTLFIISIFYYLQGIEIFDYSLFIPVGILFIVGVYDDLYNADFKLKFLIQIIVAKILIDQGYVISNYYGLFGLHEIPRVLAQLSTVFVFLVIVNAINFIDGIDGLALVQVIKTVLLVEFFSLEPTSLAPMSLILITSILPLFYFNFKKKQKIFLGDGGSLLLGTVVAVYAFYVLGESFGFKQNLRINNSLFAVLILLYPLVDLLRVFIIRIKNKRSPFQPDQNHIHHRVNKKFGQKTSLLIITILELILIFILHKMLL